MACELISEPEDANTDIAAVRNNKISITPVTYEMTRVGVMSDLQGILCKENYCDWF
jgi:broad specificity polyphosphatase/5'/3'-nucleotidase SurE